MKQLLYIALLFLCSACQLIDADKRYIDMEPIPLSSDARTHVLIDFSAFRCLNCPNAAEEAAALQFLYDSALIVVEMHPPLNPLTQGVVDYTCPQADTYFLALGGNISTGLPCGNIDFVPDNNQYLFSYDLWGTQLAQRLLDTARCSLAMLHYYDDERRRLSIEAQALMLDSTIENCQLLLWLTEDSLIGPQLLPDGSVQNDYVHNHVLRTALNGDYGVTLSKNTSFRYSATFTLDEAYEDDHCALVGLLLDAQSHEIYNALKIPTL